MSDLPPETERERIASAVLERATAIKELREVAELQNANIAALTNSVSALATAVGARPTRRETLGVATVLSAATLAVVGFMFFFVLRDLDASRENQRLLIECTTQGSLENPNECYDRGQARTAEAIAKIHLGTVFSAECAIEKATGRLEDRTVLRCVEDKLVQYEIERAVAEEEASSAD